MFNVGGGELLVILLVALIVLGPQRLPGAARQIGRVMADIRRVSSGFQQELRDAFEAEGDGTPSRRAEPVPLAKAVAEADAADASDDPGAPDGAGDRSSARTGGTPALREVPAGDAAEGRDADPGDSADDSSHGPGTAAAAGVAPVVAEALDAIVPPSAAEGRRGTGGPASADTATTAGADSADADGGDADGGDLGDERAAS